MTDETSGVRSASEPEATGDIISDEGENSGGPPREEDELDSRVDRDRFKIHAIDPDAGIFVGRDPVILASYKVDIHGDVRGDLVFPANNGGERLNLQIQEVRGRLTRAVPVQRALDYLAKLRDPDNINRNLRSSLFTRLPWFRDRQDQDLAKRLQSGDSPDLILKELDSLESSLGSSPEADAEVRSSFLESLKKIIGRAEGAISMLDFLYSSTFFPALTSRESVENLISKIGHEDLRDEARVHLQLIEQLQDELSDLRGRAGDTDVLSDESQSAIGAMIDIAKRIRVVQRLVFLDYRRRRLTIFFVIGYIGVAIAVTAALTLSWADQIPAVDKPLSELRLPLIGIPWPVILWSLIGSFASMIHRFNRHPISDFGDAVKWLLTRPVQGVVLGSAFYLVVTSGLLLMTRSTQGVGSSGSQLANEIVLVLAFLVGFSDRFGDAVFDTMVSRYSRAKEVDAQSVGDTFGDTDGEDSR